MKKNIINDKVKNAYMTKDIYIIQYKDGEEISTSNGIINEIKNEKEPFSLLHNCDTDHGSSGSPIILYNHKVIGLHRGWNSGDYYNRGTLLQYPIKEYCKKLEQKKLNDENKNINDKKVIDIKSSITIKNNLNNSSNTNRDQYDFLSLFLCTKKSSILNDEKNTLILNVPSTHFKTVENSKITEDEIRRLFQNYPPLKDGIPVELKYIEYDNSIYYGEFKKNDTERHGRGLLERR